MDINVLWSAGLNNTEKFMKHQNYLGGLCTGMWCNLYSKYTNTQKQVSTRHDTYVIIQIILKHFVSFKVNRTNLYVYVS